MMVRIEPPLGHGVGKNELMSCFAYQTPGELVVEARTEQPPDLEH